MARTLPSEHKIPNLAKDEKAENHQIEPNPAEMEKMMMTIQMMVEHNKTKESKKTIGGCRGPRQTNPLGYEINESRADC